jgi:molybdopterin-guanine dinucleotide biosynthesis protein A
MLSVAIQAGGQSSRMGQDKGLIQLGGRSLIEHVLARVEMLGDETIITTNTPEQYARFGLRMASDRIPGAGALHGLHTALVAASYAHVLLVACDMPFLQSALLEYMIRLATNGDVIVPVPGGQYEPLLAVYRREICLKAVGQALQAGERRMISFYPAVNVVEIPDSRLDELDPQRLSFFNINDANDLRTAEIRLATNLSNQDPNPTEGARNEI